MDETVEQIIEEIIWKALEVRELEDGGWNYREESADLHELKQKLLDRFSELETEIHELKKTGLKLSAMYLKTQTETLCECTKNSHILSEPE